MHRLLHFIVLVLYPAVSTAQWDQNTTPTYAELIEYYKKLDQNHKEIELYAIGQSDAGIPIYCCIINGAQDSIKTFQKASNETTILVNNGIHPGEPDGINACLLWIDRWIQQGKQTKNLPVIAIIPAYNVGGMFNRSSFSRANQNGPEEYGFRGNAQNLDLNRDCIKMDSENAHTFVKLFQALNPDVFVDTHVSNGADYQYTLTLIHSLKDRLQPSMKELMESSYFPELNNFSKKSGWDWSPYVNTYKETPDSGLVAFNDLPRYAQGYASLFHCLSITIETHMWKPFPQRVKATLDYLNFLIYWTNDKSKELEFAKDEAIRFDQKLSFLGCHYVADMVADSILFKGYEATILPSEVTGLDRLMYNRSKPYTKWIPYYNSFRSSDSIRIPSFYVVSNEAIKVKELLWKNKVQFQTLQSDSLMVVYSERIERFSSPSKPYEGHFLHTNIECFEQADTILFRAGSVIVPTNQPRKRFIVNVLDPKGEDSYFAWNFFDSYVQEKEYFSDYIFEDEAKRLLEENPSLKAEFEAKKKVDLSFAQNSFQQLFYIYRRSPYFEKNTFNRLPVFKIYAN